MAADDPFSLAGRVALIPGGYGDIGAAVARRFSAAGASVAVAGRDGARAEALPPRSAGRRWGWRWTWPTWRRSAPACSAWPGTSATGHPGQLRRHPARAAHRRGQRRGLRRGADHQPARRDVPGAGRGKAAGGRGGAGAAGAAGACAVGARATGHARPRLFGVLRDQGALVMLVSACGGLCKHGITVNGVAPTMVRGDMARTGWPTPRCGQAAAAHSLGRVAEPQDVAGPCSSSAARRRRS